MNNKKGSSFLPSGPEDLSAGSSSVIDTLTDLFDSVEGAPDQGSLPSATGIALLPEGILQDPQVPASGIPSGVQDSEHLVLGDLDVEVLGENYPRLTDLSWLEDAQQDPSRLPHKPEMIPELLEEWGVGRRTDGVHFYNDLQPAPSIGKSLPVVNIQDIARAAIRVIAAGGDASNQLQQLPENIRSVVASEIGLNGKVYIRADAYPKCDSGKWVESVRKTASSADYVIQKQACAGCTRNNQGTCSIFQKRLVATVPWDKAYTKYASRLKTAGYNVSTTSNPRQDLKNAFLTGPQHKIKETPFPILSQETISADVAIKHLANLKKEFNVVSKITTDNIKKRASLQQKLEKWVDGRYITLTQMRTLLASKADPSAVMKVASHLADANMIQSGKYSNPEGLITPSTITHDEAWGLLKEAEQATLLETRKIRETVVKQAHSYIQKFAKNGLITEQESKEILSNKSLKESILKLESLVSKKLASKSPMKGQTVESRSYSGVGVQKKASEVSTSQAKQALQEKALFEQSRDQNVKNYIQTKQATAAKKYINYLTNSGVISDEDTKGLDLNQPSKSLLDKLTTIVNRNALKPVKKHANPVKVASYSGEGLDALYGTSSEDLSLDSAFDQLNSSDKVSFASPNEIRGVLKWASEQMHEGAAGRFLDELLATRFTPSLLKAASPLLQLERESHEGLAGHLYVNASHYASPEGVTGCEKGAMKHRANVIPSVLAMSRCGSCVFKNANNTCQKYNKKLVTLNQIPDVASYKKEVIHLANASDQENTQYLFKENNVIEEFQLQKESSEIALNETPEYNQLEGVIFDGYDIE